MSEINWGSRIAKVIYTSFLNVLVWIFIPILFSRFTMPSPQTINLSSNLVFTFGILITVLQALSILTEGLIISVPFLSGSHIASAYYIFSILNGGELSFDYQSFHIEFDFPLLTYLLMLPSLFNAIKAPINYLLEESEASRPAKDIP